MQGKTRLFSIVIIFLITFAMVRAQEDSQIAIHDQNVEAFPQIQTTFSVPDSLGQGSPFIPRELEIYEKGEKNLNPFILLPPRSQSDQLDLFILIDKSSNSHPSAEVIRANLRALKDDLKTTEMGVQFHISTLDDDDLGVDSPLISFDLTQEEEFDQFLEELSFDSGSPGLAHGLNKLYQFSKSPAPPGSQKVALIINGSPFYDSRQGDSTTYNLPETINQLASRDFTVFTIGYPFRSLSTLTTENTEDGSLNHALPGGYLGSFSADLTLIPELLNKQHPQRYTLLYHSSQEGQNPSHAEFFLLGEKVGKIEYPTLLSSLPKISHEPINAHLDSAADIDILINAPHTLISLVELFYLTEDAGLKRIVMQHRRDQKTSDIWTFEAQIPAGDISGKTIPYFFIVRTPEYVMGESDIHMLRVIDYDAGIILTPTIHSDFIRWQLSGPTVDQGERFEFLMDDMLLNETTDRFIDIPLGECDLYQTVKARVFLSQAAEHERAGEWSLFSLPGEAYVGPEREVSEQEIVEVTINCVDARIIQSEKDFSALQSTYQPDHVPHLKVGLDYLTILMSGELKEDLPLYSYPPVYHLMEFIGEETYESSKNPDSPMQRSILYQVIGHLRYTEDFLRVFEEALEDYAVLLRGEVSI